MIIYSCIENLLQYAQSHLLLDDLDVIYVRNKLMQSLKLEDYVQYETDVDAIEEMTCPDAVLNPIVDYAVENGIITEDGREEFADKIMDTVSLKPSEIVFSFGVKSSGISATFVIACADTPCFLISSASVSPCSARALSGVTVTKSMAIGNSSPIIFS